jgi:lipoprotein-anchoring transpeptidase ErfK/SrfK
LAFAPISTSKDGTHDAGATALSGRHLLRLMMTRTARQFLRLDNHLAEWMHFIDRFRVCFIYRVSVVVFMRKKLRLVPLAGSIALLASSFGPVRAAQDIAVIPGIGPHDLASSPPLAAAPPFPAQPAAPVKGAYGGGFIEFLMTGNSGPSQPSAQPAPFEEQRYSPRPAPAYAHNELVSLATPEVEIDAPSGEFRRQEVSYDGHERPGTIIIDTPRKYLFLVQSGGHAIRYGIGVGRPGFEWSGVKTITRKAEWPSWTPPPQMMLRRPDLPAHMDGGPENPLGARALYLGSSLYRIHGTNEPSTIGQNVSSGCIRMMNQDVIDLYNRVPVGARVIVI